MWNLVKRFMAEEEGAIAIEYIIVALVICLGLLVSATNIRTAIQTKGTAVQTGINGIN